MTWMLCGRRGNKGGSRGGGGVDDEVQVRSGARSDGGAQKGTGSGTKLERARRAVAAMRNKGSSTPVPVRTTPWRSPRCNAHATCSAPHVCLVFVFNSTLATKTCGFLLLIFKGVSAVGCATSRTSATPPPSRHCRLAASAVCSLLPPDRRTRALRCCDASKLSEVLK